jgi:thiol-disulfide isomerase/thioredoxin
MGKMMIEQSALQVVSFFVHEATGQESLLDPVLNEHPVFIIGSDPRGQLVLQDTLVAPAHIVVNRKEDHYFVGPRFPHLNVSVNGKRITNPARLNVGDVVQIGATTLRFNQAERAVHLPSPARKPDAILPVKKPAVPSAQVARSVTPAFMTATTGQAAEVYFPKAAQAGAGGSSVVSMLLGLVTIVAIVGVLGYNFVVANGTATVNSVIPVDFAHQDGNVTIVMFDADWCVYCKQQEPILEKVASDHRGDAYVAHVDIDKSGNRALVEKYGVSATPTIVILNDQGEISSQFRGLTDQETINSAVEQALAESTGSPVLQ